MASPQPAMPRATGFLRVYSRRQNKPQQAGKGKKQYSPHLCGNVGQKDANDGAGARLGTCLEGSNAGFMPLKHYLDLLDETVRAST